MKSTAQIVTAVGRWVTKDWIPQLAGEGPSAPWPRTVPLGKPTSEELLDDLPTVTRWTHDVLGLAALPGVDVVRAGVRSLDTTIQVPARLQIESWDAALAITGRSREYATHEWHVRQVSEQFPMVEGMRLLRKFAALDDAQRDTLLRAAAYFRDNDVAAFAGQATRMIPVEGVSGKWLNSSSNRDFIEWLTGQHIEATVGRARTIRLAYVDPAHLAAGGRRHDSMTAGDTHTFPYEPCTVLIVENKDLPRTRIFSERSLPTPVLSSSTARAAL